MLDSEAMVEAGPLELLLVQNIKRQFNAQITGAMRVDAVARVPIGPAGGYELFRRGQPFIASAAPVK